MNFLFELIVLLIRYNSNPDSQPIRPLVSKMVKKQHIDMRAVPLIFLKEDPIIGFMLLA